MIYKKILIPVDGSDKSILAARHGADLASRVGAKVTLVHVIPTLPVDVRSLVLDKISAQGEEILKISAQEISEFNVGTGTEIIIGHPADAICRKARSGKYSIIVMGSRGLSGVKGYLLGSVSSAVVSHAQCPVLIVR